MYNSHSKGKSQVPTFVIVDLAQTDEEHGHPHGVSRMLLHQVVVWIHSSLGTQLEHLVPSKDQAQERSREIAALLASRRFQHLGDLFDL